MDKKSALINREFKESNGKHKKLLNDENAEIKYYLTCDITRNGYSVDIVSADTTKTEPAGKMTKSEVGNQITEEIRALEDEMEKEEVQPQKEQIVDAYEDDAFHEIPDYGLKAGGYERVIRDAVFEHSGEQKEVKLPKPGRRIKNDEPAELMVGGTIRAGNKVLSKNGKLVPHKTEYFIITTKNKKVKNSPTDQDPGYEIDEYIHGLSEVGPEPKKLKVRLACDREDLNFSTSFRKYLSAACACRGDGFSAQKYNGEIISCGGYQCPSYLNKECKRYGNLKVILESSPRCGILYTFITTSRNSIDNLTSSIALLTGFANGNVANIPLWLTLTRKETTIPDGPQQGKRTEIYMANLEFRGDYPALKEYVQSMICERNGRDPVREAEKLLEAAYELPESQEECQDMQNTFNPENAGVA